MRLVISRHCCAEYPCQPPPPGAALAFCAQVKRRVYWRPEVGYARGRQYGPLEATYLHAQWALDLAAPAP